MSSNSDFVMHEYAKLFGLVDMNTLGCKNIIYKHWMNLQANYSRIYHNFEHIASGLREINKLGDNIAYLSELKCAWIFHDVVVGCRNAELLSAVFAQNVLNDTNTTLEKEIIYDLISETAPEAYCIEGQSKTGLYVADLIHDIDFLILGQDWETFLKYDENIIIEYGARFDPYSRTKFFKLIRNMNNIYRIRRFRENYDWIAYSNVDKILREKYSSYILSY